jgi:hypothetical protein
MRMKIIKNIHQLKLVFLLFIIHAVPTLSFAQSSNTSSPYSHYGIGDVQGKAFAQGFAMGGSYIALQNDSTQLFFINAGNPASYANSRLTVAELGLNYSAVQLQNTTDKQFVHNASLGYVSLAFPIKKWWGSSFGILPYSSVGYAISDHKDVVSAGDVEFLYEGSGGFNRVYFGNAIKPLYGVPGAFLKSKKYTRLKLEKKDSVIAQILKRKKLAQGLSLGFNISYLFGNIQNSQRSIFQPTVIAFNTRSVTGTRVSDVYLDYGAQYAFKINSIHGRMLKEDVKIMLGATFSAQTNVNAKVDTLTYSYYYDGSGAEVLRDTIKLSKDTKGSITLPLSVGFGFGFKKGERWLATADVELQNWSSYQAFNQTQGLKNSMRISAGAQYTPNPKFENSKNPLEGYYKHIQYRAGLRYTQTALVLRNTQLKEYAISLGAGFPVGTNYRFQNFSMVNVGVEVGQRGTTADGLIQENFIRVRLGFTINDRWFVKPKID